MKTAQWQAQAPSNIAFIKYMGKAKGEKNLPINSSLSYSLPYLFTRVTLECIDGTEDRWEPLADSDLLPMTLSETGRKKFFNHLAFLKESWGLQNQSFFVRSGNNFPSDCGIASSASSFAALTLATEMARLALVPGAAAQSASDLARLSRQGSGSSSRSLFREWALWRGETAEDLELPYKNLLHLALIIDSTKKSVTTSQAHELVASSSLFVGRPTRAEERLENLLKAFRSEDWRKAFVITWAEFWDMHLLFLTADMPFNFLKAASMEWLNEVLWEWQNKNDGPIATVDAGANVHLFFRPDQKSACLNWQQRLRERQVAFLSNCGAV